ARVPSFLAALALFAGARTLPTSSSRTRYLLLGAASPLLLLYSAEARAYCLLALVCFALFLLALQGTETPRRLAGIALLTATAVYTHYLALFVLGALAVVAASERRLRSCMAMLAGLVPFLFWLPVMIAQPRGAVAWMHEPPSEFVTGILSSLGGAGDIPSPFGRPLPAALILIGAALALVVLVGLARLWREDVDVRRAGAFLVLFFGGVLFASLARPVAFAGRTEMAVLPVWLWTVALAGERRRGFRFAGVAIVLVSAVSSVILLVAPRPPLSHARALERIESVARPGDAVVAGAHFYLPARLAADRGRLHVPVHPFPLDQASHPGWSLSIRFRREDLTSVEDLLERTPASGRVFFQLPPTYVTPLQGLLRARGAVREIVRSPDMVVLGWSRVSRD
ncbi:MAG TPA: hypothetical protein VKS03_05035, partial [Thermoanaerobaculia bacterium]|nr:hypothetical protein [Thermoanaerobaculia bacterium]